MIPGSPMIRQHRSVRSRPRRVRQAVPAFPVGRFREIARFRAVQRDRREHGRRLYFAGDHLQAPTLQAATVTGQRAASDLLGDVGLEARVLEG